MSVRILDAAWKAHCESHTQKLVLLALSDYADDKGECWPSNRVICDKCQLSPRGVQNQISALVRLGYLNVKYGGGRHAVNRYFLFQKNPAPDTAYGVRPAPDTAYPTTETPHAVPKTPHPVLTNRQEPSGTVILQQAPPNRFVYPDLPIPEMRTRLNTLFKRDQNAFWGNDEEHALVDVAKRSDVLDELSEIEAFQKKDDFFPQKLGKLLNDWTGVLDRSRTSRTYGTNSNASKPGGIASIGTSNEGRAAAYANARAIVRGVARRTPAVPDGRQPGT